jgi:hypothetical protein
MKLFSIFLISEGKLLFASRLEESDAREHKVPTDINYSAYWDHIIYEVRNKYYHSILMETTSTLLTNVITKLTINLHSAFLHPNRN